jgi:N-acetylmuramoyl-L-alanine amidase-like protein
VFGAKTERAFRRVRHRLGLPKREEDGATAVTPRDRLVVRHLGRYLVAKRAGKAYVVPATAQRTPEEVARGKATRDWERKLRAQFKALRTADLRPEITANVVNQSSRNGVKPRLIVLHTTEGHNRPGLADLRGLVSFFDNPANQVSSHVANDAEGNDARMVPDERKAFTQASFNSVSLSIEQIAFAAQDSFPEAQLRNTAQWIAHWSKKFGIPIERSTQHGVCQHADLGVAGGGHRDCGPNYPLGKVLELARGMAA